MAPSFLTLPPEMRLQIYRYLLCHSSWIKPQKTECPDHWTRIYQAPRAWSLESAILRTCREIYSEAMPVLYGENTFVCLCWTSTFNIVEYRKTGFAAKNLKYLKHLVFEVEKGPRDEQRIAVEGIADAIQYLVKQGGNLRTFELALNSHYLLRVIAASDELMTALAALTVSDSLAISLWYLNASDHGFQKSSDDEIHGFFQGPMVELASKKRMTATKQESAIVKEATYEEESDDDGERAIYSYRLSWSLSHQPPGQQNAKVASASA